MDGPSVRDCSSTALLQDIHARPRNLWTRFRVALDLAGRGDFYASRQVLDGLKYHPDATPELIALYAGQLQSARAAAVQQINRPVDYLGSSDPRLLRPFRRLDATAGFPKPYPWGMALPDFTGSANDYRFLQESAAALVPGAPAAVRRIHVLWSPQGTSAAAGDLLTALRGQSFAGRIDLTVFAGTEGAPAVSGGADLPGGGTVTLCPHDLLSPGGLAALAAVCAGADLLVFLTGRAAPDPELLECARRQAEVSDAVVQPLVPPPEAKGFGTPLSDLPLRSRFSGRYPFREVAGLNMIVPVRLLARTGLPDGRFSSSFMAARELAYRLFVQGAWFIPLPLPGLDGYDDAKQFPGDVEIYKALSPNHWDRKRDRHNEVARVTVYIPAYNASKYIERAVESVLSQDVADLDVCIANDGSRDGTLAVLEQIYASEPRVRWSDNPNGGIGFASNTAVRMSRSLYIGQLDSDDCLRPGAVRRMADFLDENAAVVCAYSSCERINAAGDHVQNEYSWPVFSREKMMITSIAHHFRMFRRQAWERAGGFREDIVNGVDYDMFLKLSELGTFRHIDEILYQRRWHGENTSMVNEHHQTTNTWRVQRESLARQGLAPFWDVAVPDPEKPRNVTYKLRPDTKMVVFWPDYSRSNPYQRLLYAGLRQQAEVVAGDIAAALKVIDTGTAPAADVTFHLHWLNVLFPKGADEAATRAAIDDFLAKLEKFIWKGGRFVWTIHNTLSHDAAFPGIERDLSVRLAALAHRLHVHSADSVPEVAQSFPLPDGKARVSHHGHYIGVYPDHIDRAAARRMLGIAEDAEVLLFTGQIRAYKGVEDLVTAFRALLAGRPKARLILAGKADGDPLAELGLSPAEQSRILLVNRFIEDGELQLFFRAADIAAYPYRRILTSGSLLLALSFGTPVVIPRTGMTAEVLEGYDAGRLYDAGGGAVALEAALRDLLCARDEGRLAGIAANARARAESLSWPDFTAMLD